MNDVNSDEAAGERDLHPQSAHTYATLIRSRRSAGGCCESGCVVSSLQVKLSVVGRQIELLYPIHFQEVKRGAVKQQKGDPTPGVTPRGGSKVRANDVVR
jgi:hypothetical protein